jgi:hypothetical protein
MINQNFSQQVLKEKDANTRKQFEPNPFFEEDNSGEYMYVYMQMFVFIFACICIHSQKYAYMYICIHLQTIYT